MRHPLRPSLEPLESRTVLSTATGMPALASQAAPTTQATSLVVTVTTDHAVYQRGQPVSITVTEKNTSRHDVPVLVGCQILSVSGSSNGSPVWRFRDLRECATGRGVLHAGQSRQFTVVWNGRPNVSGSHFTHGWVVLRGGLDGAAGTAIIRIR